MTFKPRILNLNSLNHFFLIIFISFFLVSCGAFKIDKKAKPLSGPDQARKNIEEGRGVSLGKAVRGFGKGATTYEFSTANPMWRASLETLDFLPLTTVDYSGGIIITDWYHDNAGSSDEAIKISIRFLSNEISSENLKVTVHQRVCKNSVNCKTNLLETSNIREELHRTILRKASLLEKNQKKKKK